MEVDWQRADAVAVEGDRIGWVGSENELDSFECRGAEVVDCGGRLLLPGFIDAHAHVLATAAALDAVDCSPAMVSSIAMIVERLRARTAELPAGIWLNGHGYHEAALQERRQPTRADLDRAAAGRPLRLIHASGHASVLNSMALTQVGITTATEEPPGGTIVREVSTGEPNGLLIEMEDWLDRRLPRAVDWRLSLLLARLSERLLAAGVTSVQDLGHRNDGSRARFLARCIEDGSFRPRLTMATSWDAFAIGDAAVGHGIALGPVKIMQNETGDTLEPGPAELADRVLRIHKAGRQAAIHAVQQRSIVAALDAIASALSREPRRDHRHRIEHASLTPPPLASRIASLGVIAVSNPSFLFESGDRYRDTLPDGELPFLYDVAGLRRAKVSVAAGSDCPVSAPEPIEGILAAATRQTRAKYRLPGDLLSPRQAIELYTTAAAYAGFAEQQKGRIAPGLLADLVLLDGDLEGAPLHLRPMMTILGGAIAWRSARERD
ncbi:MAG: amidohydrolase [Dehalococcoidia bacterium]